MHLLSTRATRIVVTVLFVAILAAVLSSIPRVAAQGPPPHIFIGNASVDGDPAPAGTIITALADGVPVDSVTVDASGDFQGLQVTTANLTVTFKIGDLLAAQSLTSEVGGLTRLGLTATIDSVPQLGTSQRQILFDLYFATQGVNWRYKDKWLSREPLGSWQGVTSGPGGVSELRLGNNNLKGRIPPQLGGLSGLTYLDLRGGSSYSNELSGPIPLELGSLSNLTYLDLSNSQLNGKIPADLGSLTNLTHLNLSNNGFTGTIPAELGKLTNLVFLDLTGNKLAGSIPSALGNLRNSIETLRLQNSGLEGCIPDALKYVQSANSDIPSINLVLPFCADYTPPPTPRPTPPPTPQATATIPQQATPTPKPTTPIGQPTVNFHASQTEVMTGEPVQLTLSVANSIVRPEMTLQLVLQLPSGLLLSGEGISESCSVQCSATYQVPSGENRDFLLTAVANQQGAFDIESRMEWYFGNEAETTHDGDVETLRIVASAPVATPTPTPTPSPTPKPTLPPHVGQATVNIHASQTRVQVGEPILLTLTADNSIVRPAMTVKLRLIVPSGWSVSGTGFTGACSGTCIATYQVPTGDIRSIMLEMLANQIGTFEARAEMEWWFGTDTSTLDGSVETLELTAGPLPTATPEPAPTVPFVTSDESSDGGGGFGDTSDFALLGLLALPLVGLVGLAARSRRVRISSIPGSVGFTAPSWVRENLAKVVVLSPLLLISLLVPGLYLFGPVNGPFGLAQERSLSFFAIITLLLPPAVMAMGVYLLANRGWLWIIASGFLIVLWKLMMLGNYIDGGVFSAWDLVGAAFVTAIILSPAAIVHYRQRRAGA